MGVVCSRLSGGAGRGVDRVRAGIAGAGRGPPGRADAVNRACRSKALDRRIFAGSGPLGGYVSGGASMLFGDLLGDHQLLTAAYVSSRFDESAFGAMAINRVSRWNWGLSIDQSRTSGSAT